MNNSSVIDRLRREIDWKDWRVRWVAISIGFSTIATILIYYFNEEATDVSTFWGATFASWVGGLILAITVTLVATIAQFARPDQEVFEARARNLLRKEAGAHIDYIIPAIQKLLQPYCERVERTMVIAEFDVPTGLFRINQHTHNELKSYLNDMPVTFESKLEYANGTPAPPGRAPCSLSFLSVDGKEIGGPESFADRIVRPFEMEIIPHSNCNIDHRMVCWVKEGSEENRHFPARFTRNLSVLIENQLQSQSVLVRVSQPEGKEFTVRPGGSMKVVDVKEVPPRNPQTQPPVYNFTLQLIDNAEENTTLTAEKETT
ncbi:hypothetical protein ACEQ6A_11340 [Rhizobium brockwellii]|uniref:hypothetical protein n=1 Tax=Rhizobium brockwellii TaxID=3019932 RepID=UPI003F9A5AF7